VCDLQRRLLCRLQFCLGRLEQPRLEELWVDKLLQLGDAWLYGLYFLWVRGYVRIRSRAACCGIGSYVRRTSRAVWIAGWSWAGSPSASFLAALCPLLDCSGPMPFFITPIIAPLLTLAIIPCLPSSISRILNRWGPVSAPSCSAWISWTLCPLGTSSSSISTSRPTSTLLRLVAVIAGLSGRIASARTTAAFTAGTSGLWTACFRGFRISASFGRFLAALWALWIRVLLWGILALLARGFRPFTLGLFRFCSLLKLIYTYCYT